MIRDESFVDVKRFLERSIIIQKSVWIKLKWIWIVLFVHANTL